MNGHGLRTRGEFAELCKVTKDVCVSKDEAGRQIMKKLRGWSVLMRSIFWQGNRVLGYSQR